MAGAADLVAALTGGQAIEQDAYGKAAQRIATAQATQALMDERMQKAYAQSRKNSQGEAFGNILSTLGPELEGQNYQLLPEQVTNLYRYGVGGGVPDIENVLKGLQEQLMRQRVLQGRTDEGMTDPNAVINSYLKPELVPTVEKEGDLMIRGKYSAEPIIDALMTNENAIAGAKSDKSGSRGQRGDKINDYMSLGIPRPEAIALADSKATLEINPYTGKMVYKNDLTGESYEVAMQGGTAGTDVPAPQPDQTLYNLAEQGTGPGPVTQDLISRGLTLFGVASDMEPTEAMQTINTAKNEMIRALSINPRFPVGEINRLSEEINLAPGFLTSSATMRSRMESIDRSLRLRLKQAERDANDPSLSREIRQSQGDNAVAIRNFITQMGVPQGQGAAPQAQITPEMRSRAEAALIDVPGFTDDLTPEKQERLIQLWIQEQQGMANDQ
jgi:hypothetical protein